MGEILIVNKQNEKNFAVDLYVRSWIEISGSGSKGDVDTSTSMWGRELKYSFYVM